MPRRLTLLERCTLCHEHGTLRAVTLDVSGEKLRRHELCVSCVETLELFWTVQKLLPELLSRLRSARGR